jgi:hypothetical protein
MRTATITLALLSATTPSKAPAFPASSFPTGFTARHTPGHNDVVAGHPVKLSFFNSINHDCSSRGESTLRIIRAPQRGHVHFEKMLDFPRSISACHRRLVPGTALYYQSRLGFAGKDHLEVEVVFPSGNSRRESYLVNVLPEH